MQGMFRGNGGCGYVKKPDYLLNAGLDDKVLHPSETLPIKKTLKVYKYLTPDFPKYKSEIVPSFVPKYEQNEF